VGTFLAKDARGRKRRASARWNDFINEARLNNSEKYILSTSATLFLFR
jgi:hypothetical protein